MWETLVFLCFPSGKRGVKVPYIKVYLSAVRHLQIEAGMSDPFKESLPRLEYVDRGQEHLCPVAAVLISFLSVWGSTPGQLFMFKDGRPLTRARFAQAVRQALSEAGIDQSKYCSHSFRIGAATTARRQQKA